MSKRVFGGITGDIAGYFVQLCELGILAVSVIGGENIWR
jgi:adenosylcobinamide-GDP ribazoletransferase